MSNKKLLNESIKQAFIQANDELMDRLIEIDQSIRSTDRSSMQVCKQLVSLTVSRSVSQLASYPAIQTVTLVLSLPQLY